MTNSDGEVVVTPSTLTTVWGNIRPLSTQERFVADQANSRLTHEVELRYDEFSQQISDDWFIEDEAGTTYDVEGLPRFEPGGRPERVIVSVVQSTGPD